MTRPPRNVARSEVRPEELEFYDGVITRSRAPGRRFADDASGGKRHDYYSLMLHSPEMAYHLTQMGRLVRAVGLTPGSYSHYDREFVDQVLCPLLGTNLVLTGHIPDALAAGVRIEAIDALQHGRDEDLTDDELLLATFVRQVSTLSMTDEVWRAMEERLGERGVVELMIFTGLLNMILRMQSALGMPEASDQEIKQMISDFRSGARGLDEFVDRSGSAV
jgi:alkylhydroperoxidase family enzyme